MHWYNWNIVESGIKHHNPNKTQPVSVWVLSWYNIGLNTTDSCSHGVFFITLPVNLITDLKQRHNLFIVLNLDFKMEFSVINNKKGFSE